MKGQHFTGPKLMQNIKGYGILNKVSFIRSFFLVPVSCYPFSIKYQTLKQAYVSNIIVIVAFEGIFENEIVCFLCSFASRPFKIMQICSLTYYNNLISAFMGNYLYFILVFEQQI